MEEIGFQFDKVVSIIASCIVEITISTYFQLENNRTFIGLNWVENFLYSILISFVSFFLSHLLPISSSPLSLHSRKLTSEWNQIRNRKKLHTLEHQATRDWISAHNTYLVGASRLKVFGWKPNNNSTNFFDDLASACWLAQLTQQFVLILIAFRYPPPRTIVHNKTQTETADSDRTREIETCDKHRAIDDGISVVIFTWWRQRCAQFEQSGSKINNIFLCIYVFFSLIVLTLCSHYYTCIYNAMSVLTVRNQLNLCAARAASIEHFPIINRQKNKFFFSYSIEFPALSLTMKKLNERRVPTNNLLRITDKFSYTLIYN